MGMLFVEGIRTMLREGLDHRKSLVVALAFSIGVGMDGRGVFSDLLGETWGASLDSGMTLGALVALALTLFIEATGRRRARLEVSLDMTALPEIDRYLTTVASGRVERGLDRSAAGRRRGNAVEPVTTRRPATCR